MKNKCCPDNKYNAVTVDGSIYIWKGSASLPALLKIW